MAAKTAVLSFADYCTVFCRALDYAVRPYRSPSTRNGNEKNAIVTEEPRSAPHPAIDCAFGDCSVKAVGLYVHAAQEDGDAASGHRVSLMALKCLNNAIWDQPAGQVSFVRLGGLGMLVGLLQVMIYFVFSQVLVDGAGGVRAAVDGVDSVGAVDAADAVSTVPTRAVVQYRSYVAWDYNSRLLF